MLLLHNKFLSVEQVKNNTQRNQTCQAILTKFAKQSGKIAYDSTEERYCAAEKDFKRNPKSNQQQGNFGDLTKPSLCFFEKIHCLLS